MWESRDSQARPRSGTSENFSGRSRSALTTTEMEEKEKAIKVGNYDVSDEPMKIICRINIYFSLTVLIYL